MTDPAQASGFVLPAALEALGCMLFGYLVVDAIFGDRLRGRMKWGMAVPGFALYAFVLMCVHIVTGGRVLSDRLLVRVVTALVASALIAVWLVRQRRRPVAGGSFAALSAAGMLAALALVIWGWPIAGAVPLHYPTDIRRDMGWAHQILNGQTTPSSALALDVPNYYPWLYHCTIALLSHFAPGGNPFSALPAMQLLLVAGSILGLFALGSALTDRVAGGFAAALFGGITGGFAYFLTTHPNIVMQPRAPGRLRFLGDLLFVRSYNFAFSNLAPPFSRDLGFVLLIAFLTLVTNGLQRSDLTTLVGAGVVLGLIGLDTAESLIAGVLFVLGICLLARGRRLATLASTLGPAVALYAIWLAPVVYNYFRLGGFRSLANLPVDLPWWAAIFSWGVVTPFALYQIALLLRHRRVSNGVRVAMCWLVVCAGLLVTSIVVLPHLSPGFETLGRQHRYWPLVSLGVVLLASIGAADLFARVARRHRAILGIALATGITVLAIPSPVLASLAYADAQHPPPLVHRSLLAGPETLLDALEPRLGHSCTVAAPPSLEPQIFAFTGDRLIAAGVNENGRAWVRWRHPGGRLPLLHRRIADNQVLTLGLGSPQRWLETAHIYGVDQVVIPASHWGARAFSGRRGHSFRSPEGAWIVVRLRPCPPGRRPLQIAPPREWVVQAPHQAPRKT